MTVDRITGNIWISTAPADLVHTGVPHIYKFDSELQYRDTIDPPGLGSVAVDSDQ